MNQPTETNHPINRVKVPIGTQYSPSRVEHRGTNGQYVAFNAPLCDDSVAIQKLLIGKRRVLKPSVVAMLCATAAVIACWVLVKFGG